MKGRARPPVEFAPVSGVAGSCEEHTLKVTVDFAKCAGLGICEAMAPDVFEVGDDGALVLLKEDITDESLQLVEEVVAGCPTRALRIER